MPIMLTTNNPKKPAAPTIKPTTSKKSALIKRRENKEISQSSKHV